MGARSRKRSEKQKSDDSESPSTHQIKDQEANKISSTSIFRILPKSWTASWSLYLFAAATNIILFLSVHYFPLWHTPVFHATGLVLGPLRMILGSIGGVNAKGSTADTINILSFYIGYFRFLSHIPLINWKYEMFVQPKFSPISHLLIADIMIHLACGILWITRFFTTPAAKKYLEKVKNRPRRGKNQKRDEAFAEFLVWFSETACFSIFCNLWGGKCLIYLVHAIVKVHPILFVENFVEIATTNNFLQQILNLQLTSIFNIGFCTLWFSGSKIYRWYVGI